MSTKAAAKRYRAKHGAKIAAAQKAWRAKNSTKRKRYAKSWYAAHREGEIAKALERYHADPQRGIEYGREYYRKNRKKILERRQAGRIARGGTRYAVAGAKPYSAKPERRKAACTPNRRPQ